MANESNHESNHETNHETNKHEQDPDAINELHPERRKYEVRWLIANLFTIGYFGILLVAFFKEPPTANKDILQILLGILSGIEVMIVQFYFGSSRSTEVAQEAVTRAANKKPAERQELDKRS